MKNEDQGIPVGQTCGQFWQESYDCLIMPTVALVNCIKGLSTDKDGRDRADGNCFVILGKMMLAIPTLPIAIVNMIGATVGATAASAFFPCVKKCRENKQELVETPESSLMKDSPAP